MTRRRNRLEAFEALSGTGRQLALPADRPRIAEIAAPGLMLLIAFAAMAALVVAWIELVPGGELQDRPLATAARLIPKVETNRLMPIAPATALALNAKRPFDLEGPIPAAPQFRFIGSDASRSRATACLAAAAWYEAGDDSVGERSVIQTVLNRVRHPAFPKTVCGVVFQGSERATGCQFTFTCDGALRRRPSPAAWDRAITLASLMISGSVDLSVGVATHYHTDWVLPYWAPKLVKLAKVRTHIFYTWPGRWGSVGALRSAGAAEEPAISALAGLSPSHAAAAAITEASSTGIMTQDADIAAAAPQGIGERTLRGAIVRTSNDGDAGTASGMARYFIQIDSGTFSGNHAVAALALCRGKDRCAVYGWQDRAAIAGHLPLSAPQRETLSFFYQRGGDGSELVLWNCAQIARAKKEQCLPADAGQRAALTD